MPEGSKVSRDPIGRAGATIERALRILVPAWFVVVSGLRISVLVQLGPPGYDGLLYRDATLRWMAGADPWAPTPGLAQFAAPPPSLIAMVPFALLPESVAVSLIIALGLVGTAWALRRLGMPLWWLAFPPLVDGLWIANPHVLVLPLLVAGHGALATIVKVYAAPPLALSLRLRELLTAGLLLVITVPLLPWDTFVARFGEISAALRSQSAGTGLSVLATPILLPFTILAAVLVGRHRAAWWLVPVFWPYTQFYYASLLMPGATLLGGLIASMPIAGATAAGLIAVAVEVAGRHAYRRRMRD
jgi:hypothetical protein